MIRSWQYYSFYSINLLYCLTFILFWIPISISQFVNILFILTCCHSSKNLRFSLEDIISSIRLFVPSLTKLHDTPTFTQWTLPQPSGYKASLLIFCTFSLQFFKAVHEETIGKIIILIMKVYVNISYFVNEIFIKFIIWRQ